MKNIVSLVIGLSLIFPACGYLAGDLGGGYSLEGKLIVFSKGKKHNDIAHVVVPPSVLKLNYNEDWVIVSSQNMRHQIVYWIIDKRIEGEHIRQHPGDSIFWIYDVFSNVIGPFDSSTFYEKMEEKQIGLLLE